MILKRVKHIFILLAKLLYLNIAARLKKKSDKVILVPEFALEGGALTYFRYVTDYFEAKNLSYQLVLSAEQKEFVERNIKLRNCTAILIGPTVWRPNFIKKNGLTRNLELLINQLQELLFFSKLNAKFRPAYFYFSVTNPEHYLFEFCLHSNIFYVCHTSPADKMDALKQKILNSQLSNKKKIIAVSDFERNEMILSWQVKKSKIKYITVVHNFYEPISDVNHETIKSPKKSAVSVLTIGALEYYKNPIPWLCFAKKITDLLGAENVVFIWLGSGSLFNTCVTEGANYPNIYFEGYRENIEAYYEKADIYVQPSVYESFGISVVGAMYHKLPCVVSDAGGLPELVSDKNSGFVIPLFDEKIYIDCLKALFDDEQLRYKMGMEGFTVYEEKFKKRNWLEKMDELFVYTQNL